MNHNPYAPPKANVDGLTGIERPPRLHHRRVCIHRRGYPFAINVLTVVVCVGLVLFELGMVRL